MHVDLHTIPFEFIVNYVYWFSKSHVFCEIDCATHIKRLGLSIALRYSG